MITWKNIYPIIHAQDLVTDEHTSRNFRFLLYDGDLIEMDTNDHSALHRTVCQSYSEFGLVMETLKNKGHNGLLGVTD